MDINFRLFSERLRRVLASKEVTLPDAAKQPIQNLLAKNEIITSWLRDFEYETSWLLVQKIGKEEIDDPDLGNIMDEINCFPHLISWKHLIRRKYRGSNGEAPWALVLQILQVTFLLETLFSLLICVSHMPRDIH
ncbi:hypothetical protein WN943_001595 [Citrus x changshan-huyou]